MCGGTCWIWGVYWTQVYVCNRELLMCVWNPGEEENADLKVAVYTWQLNMKGYRVGSPRGSGNKAEPWETMISKEDMGREYHRDDQERQWLEGTLEVVLCWKQRKESALGLEWSALFDVAKTSSKMRLKLVLGYSPPASDPAMSQGPQQAQALRWSEHWCKHVIHVTLPEKK